MSVPSNAYMYMYLRAISLLKVIKSGWAREIIYISDTLPHVFLDYDKGTRVCVCVRVIDLTELVTSFSVKHCPFIRADASGVRRIFGGVVR